MNNPNNRPADSFDTPFDGQDIADPAFWNNPMFDEPGAGGEGGVDMDVSPGPAGMEGAGFDAHGWRDATASSPPHSPATFSAPLPLGTDSPVVPTYDNFDAPAFPTFQSAHPEPQQTQVNQGYGQAPRMFAAMPHQHQHQQQQPYQSQPQPVMSYARPIMMHPAGPSPSYHPPALGSLSTSPPNSSDHLRRQAAMISSAGQPVPLTPSSLAMQAQGSHGPSPLGRYYLASSDPNRAAPIQQHQHQGASPVIPNLPSMGATNQSPTLSMASDDTFVPLDGTAAMFPPIAGVGMTRVISGGGRLPPHMVPLPPSPAYPYGQPRNSFDVGNSPLSRVEESFAVPAAPASDPARLRQTTAESFVSTSSEEEELTSPMVLPDTSMARRRSAAGSTGRGSPRFTVSPRSPVVGTMGASGSNVRGKMFGPIPSQAQFTFQAPGRRASGGAAAVPERPSFAPMSSSSSDGGDSDDDYIRSKSEEAADERRAKMFAQGGGRWAKRAGGGMYDSEQGGGGEGGADASAFRSQSITVGGSGYVDQSQYGTNGGGIGAGGGGGGGSDDGDDDPNRPNHIPKVILDSYVSPKKDKGKDKDENRDPNLPADPAYHNASESEEEEIGGEDADGEEGEGEYVAEGSNGQNKKRKKNKGGEKDADGKKRRKSVVGEGEVVCDYIELEPPYQKCTSRFHRTYDLQRHRETIHARNEGRLVSKGKLKLEDAKQFLAFGQPQIEWPCPFNCGQIFSRKDAMQRHLKTKKH